jgi:hypothetical protein
MISSSLSYGSGALGGVCTPLCGTLVASKLIPTGYCSYLITCSIPTLLALETSIRWSVSQCIARTGERGLPLSW